MKKISKLDAFMLISNQRLQVLKNTPSVGVQTIGFYGFPV
jgi:hypothetical protein